MTGAHDAPDDADRKQNADRVAGADMGIFPFVTRDEGKGEERDKRPVEDPHQRIPHLDPVAAPAGNDLPAFKRDLGHQLLPSAPT